MVATSGRGWQLAPCLVELFKEADRRKPGRSHASDGSLGDQAHAVRASDHNPADGWVTAGDLDDDHDSTPVLGVDLLVAHLTETKDPRVKYIIRNGRIWQPSTGWKPYTGINAHSQHAHISVWNTPEARNDLRPWWPTAKPLPPTAEETEMMIVTCKGQPTRLLAPPLCPVIDGPTVANIQAKGIPTVEWERDDYDALLSHVVDALGR